MQYQGTHVSSHPKVEDGPRDIMSVCEGVSEWVVEVV